MFEGLTGKLGGIFDRLSRRGALTEADVTAALREVRIALLEADVALPVVKDFIERVRERAVGQEVLRSIKPGQQVVKIVHDNLVEMLGGTPGAGDVAAPEIDLRAAPPVAILMVGLQGSGKTTTTAKIARRLTGREKKRVLMASLDVQRPAAQEQLRVLGTQIGVATLPIIAGQQPVDIARRALATAKAEGFDAVMLDTAGRLAIDDALMAEVAAVRDVARPHETLLVVDAMTGQDAVATAKSFDERVGLTGIVMTRIDGDARGGAALSMRAVTGKPIKLLGSGEKLDALEPFHAERIAGRILGMGDIVSLVERAAETIDREDAEKLAAKLAKGGFDLDDFASQLKQIRKLGGMGGMMKFLPGIGKLAGALQGANMDESVFKRQEAIISSMTPKERRTPDLIKASRKKRIAAGSGTDVADVNRLLKQFQQMQDMMKQMRKLSGKGGMPDLKAMQKAMKQSGAEGGMPELPPGFPDMGGKLPGLGSGGGLPGLGGGGMPRLPGLGGGFDPRMLPPGGGKKRR